MKYNNNYIYLGLGANLRSLSYNNINNLIASIKIRLPRLGLRVTSSSNNWITCPIPYSNIPNFINCVIKCIIIRERTNNPHNLLRDLKNLEKVMGRGKKKKNISRIVDIDILDFKGLVVSEELILPHPRMHLRKFVLSPLKTIDKNWKHPISNLSVDSLFYKIKTAEHLKEKL
jgi:2-amino-4-hydroxy-6-hydroxymethyldihydropteridine diphosphokinase